MPLYFSLPIALGVFSLLFFLLASYLYILFKKKEKELAVLSERYSGQNSQLLLLCQQRDSLLQELYELQKTIKLESEKRIVAEERGLRIQEIEKAIEEKNLLYQKLQEENTKLKNSIVYLETSLEQEKRHGSKKMIFYLMQKRNFPTPLKPYPPMP